MNLLNLLRRAAADHRNTADARKSRRSLKPTLDGLEKREVFTAGITAQVGVSLGMAWRFAPDANGGGTMYVQDVAKGTNSADPKNLPIAINASGGKMIFDTDFSNPSYGPNFKPGQQVKVVVAATSGDLTVYDDRNAGTGGLKTENRHQTGNISVDYGTLAWTMDSNVVTQKAVFSVASGKYDHSVYNINATHLNPESGVTDPANPIIGLEVTDSGNGSGGCDFLDGIDVTQKSNVTIRTSGGATWKNNSGF